MKTSENCYTTQFDTDSVKLRKQPANGIIDPDWPNGLISIYPNPVTREMTITGLIATKRYTVTLQTAGGHLVFKKSVHSVNQYTINTLENAAGLYVLTVYDEVKQLRIGSIKVLKQNK